MLNNDWADIVNNGKMLEEYSAISQMKQYKIQVTLELLEGCSYHCPGCFVKRRGNWHPESIALFHSLAYELKDRTDIVLDDIVIGPTDFYGAENLEEILDNPRLADAILMMPEDNRNIQHNCSILGSLSEKDIEGKIKKVENSRLGAVVKCWDVQIALDLNRLLNDDVYRQALENRVKMFEDSSLEFEISMATNIVDNIESILFEAIDYTREKYSTVIEILPSVVRSLSANSKHAVKLFKWNSMLDTFAKEPDFKNKFHFLQGDISHKTFQYAVVNIHFGKFYASPFIYENAQIYKESFEIKINDSIHESILAHKDAIVNKQIESSANKECGSCKYLTICSHRMIPQVMDTFFKDRYECILNKDVISIWDYEVYRGNSY